VDASPSAGTETIIATLTLSGWGDMAVVSGVRIRGWVAFTVGASGVSANLRIRQTNVSGSIIAATGATSVTAGNLYETSVNGFDAGVGVATYVLTLTVGSGAAASTVSALLLEAIII
jgi:hypothetical protein